MIHTFKIFIMLLVMLPAFVQAETVLRSGANIAVESEQSVAGDYYVSAGPFGSTVMSGTIAEDMYAFGAAITVNGEVGVDATLLGGTVQVHAPVGDDLRIVGGEVVVENRVEGDLFVFGGVVEILSTASVGGDVFIFGGNVNIAGDVDGSVFARVEQMTINGIIGKGIDVTAPAGLTLGEQAVVTEDVRYMSYLTLNRTPSSVVEGEVIKTQPAAQTTQEKLQDLLVPFFITLFTALSLYLLFKPQLQTLLMSLQKESGKGMLIGAGVLIAGPIVALVLMMTMLGMLVGMAMLSLLIALYVISFALTGAVLGVLLMRVFVSNAAISLSTIVLGTALLHALLFVPVVGVFTLIVVLCMTLGCITLLLYRAIA